MAQLAQRKMHLQDAGHDCPDPADAYRGETIT